MPGMVPSISNPRQNAPWGQVGNNQLPPARCGPNGGSARTAASPERVSPGVPPNNSGLTERSSFKHPVLRQSSGGLEPSTGPERLGTS